MTAGEWALLIGLLANAGAVWFGMRRIGRDIHTVEVATNSMKDELVKATAKASRSQGDAEGREHLKAEQAAEDGPHDIPFKIATP